MSHWPLAAWKNCCHCAHPVLLVALALLAGPDSADAQYIDGQPALDLPPAKLYGHSPEITQGYVFSQLSSLPRK